VEKYSALETEKNALSEKISSLEAELTTLVEFKKGIERKDKEAMIASFYMLSDEDKKAVVENIDNYSLDDIEAKLSIICVRNKVSFNLEDDSKPEDKPVVYSLDGNMGDDSVPAWVKSLRDVAKSLN
jgi:hypothetical protein